MSYWNLPRSISLCPCPTRGPVEGSAINITSKRVSWLIRHAGFIFLIFNDHIGHI